MLILLEYFEFLLKGTSKTLILILLSMDSLIIFFENLLFNLLLYVKTLICRKLFLIQLSNRDIVDLGVSHNPESNNPLSPKFSLIQFKEQFGARGVLRIVYQKDYRVNKKN